MPTAEVPFILSEGILLAKQSCTYRVPIVLPVRRPLSAVVFVVITTASGPVLIPIQASAGLSPSRSGIIIRSVGNVTVLHRERRCLLEPGAPLFASGPQGWAGGHRIVTYGVSRVSLDGDVNCEQHDVL